MIRLKVVRFIDPLFVAGIGGTLAEDGGDKKDALRIYEVEGTTACVMFYRNGEYVGHTKGYEYAAEYYHKADAPELTAGRVPPVPEKEAVALPAKPKRKGPAKGSRHLPKPGGKPLSASFPNVLKDGQVG